MEDYRAHQKATSKNYVTTKPLNALRKQRLPHFNND
jgi:hypothetical protein